MSKNVLSASKKVKVTSAGDGDNDELGNLPEAVLSHILSLLPTKDAVRTSILSTKWRYKWALITSLYFDDRSILYPHKKAKNRKIMFINFVERVLLLLGNSTIQEFHLSCDREHYDPNHILTWILAALSHDARKIKVTCPLSNSLAFLCFTSYGRFVLEELELLMFCTIRVESYVPFSNLKIMDLTGITFLNESVLSTGADLCFCFNVLEVLSLVNCRWENVIEIYMYAPKLVSFSMRDEAEQTGIRGTCECLLMMRVPRLATFECCGYSVANVILDCPSAIVDLCIEVPSSVSKLDNVHKDSARLLTEFSDAKSLTISSEIIKDGLPKLKNLIQLTVTEGKFDENLMALLHRAPILEYLTFAESFSHKKDANVLVPQCILSHIKAVEFQLGWMGVNDDWLKIARFFLKNAKALEEMIIKDFEGYYLDTKEMEELLECPRCSSRASIVFTE